MIFTILVDVFQDDSDSNIRLLDEILHLSSERHRLYIDDYNIIDSLKNSNWYKELRNSYKKQIEEDIVRSSQSSKPKSILTISNNLQTNFFSTYEALEILKTSVQLILENNKNDAHFIRSLIKNFKKESEKIHEHLFEGWLEFSMGGGSTIPDVIEASKKRFEVDKKRFPKESYVYLRYFVVIDSDNTYQNAPLKKEKESLIKLLIENNIKYHIWKKREVENYMPDVIFREIQGNENYIKAYLELESGQKDYFDIENGLPDKNYCQLPTEIQSLYLSVSDENKKILRKNKLDMIDSNGKRVSFKSEFPKLFLNNSVNKENLQERCGTNELNDILDEIAELL